MAGESSDDADLEAFFRARCGAPIVRRLPTAADDDADMRIEPGGSPLEMPGVVLQFVYCNANQEEDDRVVRLGAVYAQNDNIYIHGYCLTRHAHRLFRADRIEEIVDWRTGEILDDAENFFASLGVTARSPPRVGLIGDLMPGLTVLSALARADRKLVRDEVEAILRWADAEAMARGMTLDPDAMRVVERIAVATSPSPREAVAALDAARMSARDPRSFARAIRAVVIADGLTQNEEVKLMKNLKLAFDW